MQLLHSHQFSGPPLDESIANLTQITSESTLREWVRHLAQPRHFLAEPAQNRRTAEWLGETLSEFGYEVQFQGASRNVVALPRGLVPGSPTALVGAHYDSVPGSPGADDNASAVAALLGCAAALARTSRRTIFVAFNREEDGFIGSREFVEEYLGTYSVPISCAYILEMVGYADSSPGSQRLPSGLPIRLPAEGNFLGLLANDQSAAAMRRVLELSRTYTPDLPLTGLTVIPGAERAFPVLARSDHVPFWARGIPSMMWTDTAEFRNLNYHGAADTPETLDYAFLHKVTQLLTATVASL